MRRQTIILIFLFLLPALASKASEKTQLLGDPSSLELFLNSTMQTDGILNLQSEAIKIPTRRSFVETACFKEVYQKCRNIVIKSANKSFCDISCSLKLFTDVNRCAAELVGDCYFNYLVREPRLLILAAAREDQILSIIDTVNKSPHILKLLNQYYGIKKLSTRNLFDGLPLHLDNNESITTQEITLRLVDYTKRTKDYGKRAKDYGKGKIKKTVWETLAGLLLPKASHAPTHGDPVFLNVEELEKELEAEKNRRVEAEKRLKEERAEKERLQIELEIRNMEPHEVERIEKLMKTA